MSKNQDKYKEAKKLIPGGTHLFSKRPEMFLPDKWPNYYSKSKDFYVWDLDGNRYADMAFYVGANTLGYCCDFVDEGVLEAIKKGNMTSLNAPEEVDLARKLIELHPWFDMARFARSGGEANAIAIRIARSASKNDKVAICGYHGWHDWYLSANHNKKDALGDHVMSGLDAAGVPKNLANLVFPFKYNDFEGLLDLVKKENIGTIKMEVTRNFGPENNFLEKIRDLATRKGIILIFDECTSGFRETYGGIHKKFGVQPDIAMFGKALGNGYAITAILGKGSIMQHAQDSFISSTFWTERVGYVAALKTLDRMNQINSWDLISRNGAAIKKNWRLIAEKYDLPISISGIDALPLFAFHSNQLEYKTFITQEMLKQNILATNSIYSSIFHTEDNMSEYYKVLDSIFKVIKECEDGKDIFSLLEGPVCHSGFSRLN